MQKTCRDATCRVFAYYVFACHISTEVFGKSALYPAWSRYAARKRLGIDPIEITGGHYLQLSRPAQLADVLVNML